MCMLKLITFHLKCGLVFCTEHSNSSKQTFDLYQVRLTWKRNQNSFAISDEQNNSYLYIFISILTEQKQFDPCPYPTLSVIEFYPNIHITNT